MHRKYIDHDMAPSHNFRILCLPAIFVLVRSNDIHSLRFCHFNKKVEMLLPQDLLAQDRSSISYYRKVRRGPLRIWGEEVRLFEDSIKVCVAVCNPWKRSYSLAFERESAM